MTVRREIAAITARIAGRSRKNREAYLARVDAAIGEGPHRTVLSCGNLAHGFAACGPVDKALLAADRVPNLGIVTSYNDMLSAHQPFETYPQTIKLAAREAGPATDPFIDPGACAAYAAAAAAGLVRRIAEEEEGGG